MMDKYERFRKLWKVRLLLDLKNLDDFKGGTVTRSEIASMERDLRMIRYGFDNGWKLAKFGFVEDSEPSPLTGKSEEKK